METAVKTRHETVRLVDVIPLEFNADGQLRQAQLPELALLVWCESNADKLSLCAGHLGNPRIDMQLMWGNHR